MYIYRYMYIYIWICMYVYIFAWYSFVMFHGRGSCPRQPQPDAIRLRWMQIAAGQRSLGTLWVTRRFRIQKHQTEYRIRMYWDKNYGWSGWCTLCLFKFHSYIEDGHRNCVSVQSYKMVMFHGYVYKSLPEGNTWRNESAWERSWETVRENHLILIGLYSTSNGDITGSYCLGFYMI